MHKKKKEKQTTEFTSMTYALRLILTPGLKELQISYSCNNSRESSPKAPYTVTDFLQMIKRA